MLSFAFVTQLKLFDRYMNLSNRQKYAKTVTFGQILNNVYFTNCKCI